MSLSKFCRSVQLSTPSLGETPNQPRLFKFPQREFGRKAPVKRSFQSQWFDRWPWIHYDEGSDAAFCFLCVKAYSQKSWTTAVAWKLRTFLQGIQTGRMRA